MNDARITQQLKGNNTMSPQGKPIFSDLSGYKAEQQAKHTPGPWFSKRRGTQGVANYAVIETAANWHTEIARVYFGDRFVNGEANARLIAAAPDLLAALNGLLNCFNSNGEIEETAEDQLSVALENAEKAQAKAEGR